MGGGQTPRPRGPHAAHQDSTMTRHPNKHINAAIKYAVSKGWTQRKGGGHAFVVIYCPAQIRGGHKMSVWSTPRNPEAHARDIVAYVDSCQHSAE